jgi:arylsulfatase A-like enzyme
MLEEMDKGVGEILDTVKRCEISDRTLVFFLSDNGAIGAGSNLPLRGGKFSHYEGGHRVPAIAWWPGKIKPGSSTDSTVMAMDFLPTALDLAGLPVPTERKLDGTSMKDLLLEQTKFPNRKLFFGYEPKLGTAMRDGAWKMIIKGDKKELYNLETDLGETTNLVGAHPDRAAQMATAIGRWKLQVQPGS